MTLTADRRQFQAWNGSVGAHWASHHEQYDGLLADVNDPLFEAAAIGTRDRVLDVGCGAGATTRVAARIASQGRVLGVDISAPLLDRARAATAAEGLTNVAYERDDAQLHAFEPESHDVVISRGGVMFFADHRAAFDNLARALRPGGRLAFICPQPTGPDVEEARALSLFSKLLEEHEGPARPSADTVAAQAAMASLAEPDRIREVLGAFTDVTVAPVSVRTRWGRDAADTVDFVLSRTPDPEVSEVTRAALEEALRPYETPEGVLLRAGVWLVTAARPH